MNEMKFRPVGVIFDMDGLMLETEKPMIPCFIKAGKLVGYDINSEMAIRTIGNSKDSIQRMLIEEYGNSFPIDDFQREMSRLTTEAFENGIDLKPGLLPLLDFFSGKGIPMTVATSTNRKRAIWKLQIAGILDRFTAIVTRDDVPNGKPAPDIFLKAAEEMGVSAGDCIGFEDSPSGLKGLHAAGIRSIFIKDVVEPPAEVLSLVWQQLRNLEEAIELF
ncbi:MAG: HAD family phosphatase [Treponema sp.]|nr:HAD family phosphatase [Treponema sp.]